MAVRVIRTSSARRASICCASAWQRANLKHDDQMANAAQRKSASATAARTLVNSICRETYQKHAPVTASLAAKIAIVLIPPLRGGTAVPRSPATLPLIHLPHAPTATITRPVAGARHSGKRSWPRETQSSSIITRLVSVSSADEPGDASVAGCAPARQPVDGCPSSGDLDPRDWHGNSGGRTCLRVARPRPRWPITESSEVWVPPARSFQVKLLGDAGNRRYRQPRAR
jgi:hypothetical protein